MKYYAQGGNARFIIEDSNQLDSLLQAGYSIVQIDGDGAETCIATPESGFTTTRPEFNAQGTACASGKLSNELEKALNIILGKEPA